MYNIIGYSSFPMFMTFGGMLMWLVMGAIIILPFWFIFPKAGFSKWLSLLMAIPMVNILTIYFLAFSKWPRKDNKDKKDNKDREVREDNENNK